MSQIILYIVADNEASTERRKNLSFLTAYDIVTASLKPKLAVGVVAISISNQQDPLIKCALCVLTCPTQKTQVYLLYLPRLFYEKLA